VVSIVGSKPGGSMAVSFEPIIEIAALIAACRGIVRIPSETGSEAAAAEYLAALMRDLGFDSVQTDDNGNVIGILKGSGHGPSVMINGHLDHVPAGDMVDPFWGALVDGSRWGEAGDAIYGRGTCDMKCNVVAAVYAVSALKVSGQRTGGDVILVADVEEETDSPKGIASVIAGGLRTDYGISVESTNGGVYLGHRGKLEFLLTVRGRTAHASEPTNGINAIGEALKYATAFEEYAAALPRDDHMGPATAVVVGFHSSPDNGSALLPDRCELQLDRRYVRGETPESCEAEIREVLSAVSPAMGDPWALTLFNHYPLMFTPEQSPVAIAAKAAVARVHGGPARVSAWRFGVNGTFMAAAGIPTIGPGPGDEK